MVGSAGTGLKFNQANAGDWNIANLTSDKDIIFSVLDGASVTEVMRLNGDVSSLDIATSKSLTFGDAGEHIVGDGNDLSIVSSGDIILSGADVKMTATKKLYFDGGGDTYIEEAGTDNVRFNVGGDRMFELTEDGATNGNFVSFRGSGVGFIQFEPTYNATDTYVYFNRNGNKAHLTFEETDETIKDIHLHFPNISCNCVLLVTQHGSGGGAVTNWKTFDQAGGNESEVYWAGGGQSNEPTLTTTASKTDIMSFYWDNDNHKAYGVASLNF